MEWDETLEAQASTKNQICRQLESTILLLQKNCAVRNVNYGCELSLTSENYL